MLAFEGPQPGLFLQSPRELAPWEGNQGGGQVSKEPHRLCLVWVQAEAREAASQARLPRVGQSHWSPGSVGGGKEMLGNCPTSRPSAALSSGDSDMVTDKCLQGWRPPTSLSLWGLSGLRREDQFGTDCKFSIAGRDAVFAFLSLWEEAGLEAGFPSSQNLLGS